MAQTSLGEMADLGTSPHLALPTPNRHRLVRWFFIALGSLLVGVGVVGVFLPLLPSTVFFLMAAACYGKSSPGAYHWLTTNRFFGRHLKDYKEERGATVGAKVMAIGSLWIGIAVSEYLLDPLWLRVALGLIALAVTVHLLRLRTIRR